MTINPQGNFGSHPPQQTQPIQQASTPPGWYQNPNGHIEWWDGIQWTGHFQQQAPQPPNSPPQQQPITVQFAGTPPARKAKSLGIAYLIWLIGGIGFTGIHWLYLGYPDRMIKVWATIGMKGVFIDPLLLPEATRIVNMQHGSTYIR